MWWLALNSDLLWNLSKRIVNSCPCVCQCLVGEGGRAHGGGWTGRGLGLLYSTVSIRQLLFVWCSLSDDHQTIVRCLSDVPPDIYQLPPDKSDKYHIYTRHVPYAHQTLYCAICTPDVHQTYWQLNLKCMSGVYVVVVWQMSGGSWQTSGKTSDRHLALVWQSSDREHQTNSNCLAETVVYRAQVTKLGQILSPVPYRAHSVQ